MSYLSECCGAPIDHDQGGEPNPYVGAAFCTKCNHDLSPRASQSESIKPNRAWWKFWLWAVLLIALLGACADPPPDRGYIRDKDYDPEHDHYHPGTTYCAVYNSNGTCAVYMTTAGQWHHHEDDGWRFFLEDCKLNDEGEEECDTGWLYVTEATYYEYGIGDIYPPYRSVK